MRLISVILFFSGFVSCVVGLVPIGVIMILGGIFFWSKADTDAPAKNNSATRSTSQKKTRTVPQPPVKTKTTTKKTKARSQKNDFNHRNIQVPGAPAVDAYAYGGSQEDYFHALLTNAFPGYTVRRNVPVDKLYTGSTTGSASWTCSCGASNTTAFCGSCGKSKPAPEASASWTCKCGACNTTVFCGSCGARRPAAPAPVPKFHASQAYTANISFLLCQNGTPKLAIMLGDRDYRYQYVCDNTEKALIAQGIPVQYYIDTFRNKASYIYSRVMDQLA